MELHLVCNNAVVSIKRSIQSNSLTQHFLSRYFSFLTTTHSSSYPRSYAANHSDDFERRMSSKKETSCILMIDLAHTLVFRK